jgi:hypothetical protein
VLAYLDGSGDEHKGDAQEFVSLAAIAAYKEQWERGFHGAWDELIGLNAGKRIHAAELYEKGFVAILDRAVSLIAALQRPSFHVLSCVVNLADYRRVMPLCPKLLNPPDDDRPPKPAEAVCVDWCVGHLLNRVEIDYETQTPVDIGLVFDRNEEFLRWIYRVWTAPRQIRPWWARKRT